MKAILSVAVFVALNLTSFAQGIKGVIMDDKKQPIPFATIYVENLKTGTNSNVKGEYEISLKPGNYKVLFRSLGYKQVAKVVAVENGFQSLNIEMPTEVYQMKEVIVSKGVEDPAYPIMRKVIAWAPYHLNQVRHYKSEVYMKGTMVIDKIPRLLKNRIAVSGNNKIIKINTGDVYLEESVNEITFDAPKNYKQVIKSSQSSFPNLGNQAMAPIEFIKSSLYQSDLIDCISPLAPNAFSHYKFVYEGFSEEGDYVIDKIKVVPRRKSQQLFSGYIYIVDQYWCIHSADITNEQFWGTVKVKQLCSPIKDGAWLPVTYNFHFIGSFLGLKGQFRYSSSVKYNDIKVDERLVGPAVLPKATQPADETKPDKKSALLDDEMQTILAKEKLSFRDMQKIRRASKKEQKRIAPDTLKSLEIKSRRDQTVEPGATKRDTSYWAQNRAIPLTLDELKSYHRKDSIVQASAPDTSKSGTKKHKPGTLSKIVTGFSVPSKDSSLWFRYDGLIRLGGISFNTVDGWLYKQSCNINMKLDSTHNIWISPELKYAFNRKELMGYFNSGYNYAPMRNGALSLGAGVNTVDFNQSAGIKVFENTVSSLFFRENYMKLFERKYVNLSNDIDLANGLRLNTSANFTEMRKLRNHSDYSFFYRNQRDYTLNIPENDFFSQEQPLKERSFTLSAGLTFTPEYYYRIENHKKRMLWSKYPTFELNYKTAINGVFDSNSRYQLITGGIKQKKDLKFGASIEYNLLLGAFFNIGEIHFSEFKHFNTQPLPVTISRFGQSFQLLDFYKYSTSSRFAEGHIHYESQLLLLKYLPLLSNTIWSENVYFNYLSTPVLKNYMELGYGLNNIALLANIGLFTSFENGRYKSVGAKLSINFGN